MKKKTILLVCAAGFATTSMMKYQIEGALEERGIDVDIKTTTVPKIPYFLDQADLIVTSLSLKEDDYDIPVINGIALLTGMGSDVIEEIIEKLDLEAS